MNEKKYTIEFVTEKIAEEGLASSIEVASNMLGGALKEATEEQRVLIYPGLVFMEAISTNLKIMAEAAPKVTKTLEITTVAILASNALNEPDDQETEELSKAEGEVDGCVPSKVH